MRSGIRRQILDNVPSLKDCYEPNVPTYETPKPYGVVVQGPDTSMQDPTSFRRTIEIWLYNDIDTFKTLDALTLDTIKALDLKTFTDPDTGSSYTSRFNGTIGQDILDEEWNAIARGLEFSIVALHNKDESSVDTWVDAIARFTEKKVGVTAYRDTWKKDFSVPSLLWRTINVARSPINMAIYKETRNVRCHVVSDSKAEITDIIDCIEQSLIHAIKIPWKISERRYLTIESIREDRSADMLGTGQLTVELARMQKIDRTVTMIEKTYSRGSVE